MRMLITISGLFLGVILNHAGVCAQDFDTLWTKIYWNNYFDSANCLQETSDGGFIMVGCSQLWGETQFDVDLVKADADGNLDWIKRIGDEHHETGFHVIQTNDGGYLISAQSDAYGTGTGNYRIWIIKTDAAGDTTWTYPLSGVTHNGFPLHAIQTYDSGYAITGLVNISYDNKAFILKLNKNGGFGWFYTYGDSDMQDGWFIAELADSDLIVAGQDRNTYTTELDFWAFRTTRDGIQLWDSTYAITNYAEEMHGACLVDDGLVMVGEASGSGHAYKIDFDGHTVWSKPVSLAPTNEELNSVCPTPDGGVMVGGWVWVVSHRRDFSFIKLDSDGNIEWNFAVGGDDDDHGQSLVPTADGGYAMLGSSSSFENGNVFYLVKVSDMAADAAESVPGNLPDRFVLKENYPNPFNLSTVIGYDLPHSSEVKIDIFNILGQSIRHLIDEKKAAGCYNTTWNGLDNSGQEVSSGIYFYQIKANEFVDTRKMILLK